MGRDKQGVRDKVMKLYSSDDSYKLYQGNMLDLETCIKPSSIDSIVTDPPYELGFMGKGWDSSGVAFQKETWEHCLRVLKPGGYLLAFGGSRTFHRITCAIEDAGFEIRDVIMWLYGSGFPKSMNIGLAIDKKNGVESEVIGTGKSGSADTHTRTMTSITNNGVEVFGGEYDIKQAQNEWAGWGTALKPSYEPIIVARKPCEGSCIDNVLHYGVGGINIDDCRIGTEERTYKGMSTNNPEGAGVFRDDDWKPKDIEKTVNGRFPANTILTYDDTDYEEVCGGFPNSGSGNGGNVYSYSGREYHNKNTSMFNGDKPQSPSNYNDTGSAARYFYCAKASKRDRDEGLDKMNPQKCNDGRNTPIDNAFQRGETLRKNIHPTVKPTDLMQYLVRLVTPVGGGCIRSF